jgi:MAPEG family
MGNGRYTIDWSYDQWFTFNNYQRAHYNYMEHLTQVIVWILISIFYQPLAAAILGFIYALGRLIY